uniref:PDZ domain-containing protein n=1 Tax=Heterorhabditis bacteriophora TaxID=37862 RepID=A0A1I7XFJ7_HETBA
MLRKESLMYPAEYNETYMVRKPMGVRIHKSDGRITHIEVNSVLTGKAFVGDTIVEIDNVPITKIEELYKKLKEPNEKVTVKIRHGTWSYCQHKITTVEKIQMDKDNEKVTGRAIDIYYIVIRISCAPELKNLVLGVNVKYDARERLQVFTSSTNWHIYILYRPIF